ncbi:hypothetical protein QQZ08_004225 [Neonectria magnoliae]|uniref:Uncharacterized protein n=1 Tax=Neonectria magnoliae TaxID=2732573 RepID=A0ABR1I896_9HYPO
METPVKRSSRIRRPSVKAAASPPVANSTPKKESTPNAKPVTVAIRSRSRTSSMSSSIIKPSSISKPKIASKPSDNSSTTAASPKAISNAIASLSFEYQVPITISQDDNDQKIIRDVMVMYISDGAKNWNTDTKIAFVKALSLIKTTPSAETVTSNHGIWRAVVQRREGWNWAYWIVFRAIYGKAVLESRTHVTDVIQEMYPNTDIWSATTPTSMASTTSNVCPVARASDGRKFDEKRINERKRPRHHTLDTSSGLLRQNPIPERKKRRVDPVSRSTRVLSPSGSSKDGESDEKHTPPQETTGEYLKSPASEANANEASLQDIVNTVPMDVSAAVADTTLKANALSQEAEIATAPYQGTDDITVATMLPEIDTVTQETDIVVGSHQSTDATTTTGNVDADADAKPLNTAKTTDKPAVSTSQADRDSIFQQMKEELSAQFAAQLRESESRAQLRVEELIKSLPSSRLADGHACELFAQMLSIKQRLSALEEANRVRLSEAATFNIPAALTAEDTRRALEALGHQVQKCTRDIYQLHTGQLYEEDPMLSCIKREPIPE